mgnify:CR=1 FL=1
MSEVLLSVENTSLSRYDTRVDYVFCGPEVRARWKASRAWHSEDTISDHNAEYGRDHNAVFVVFKRHSCSEDPAHCSEHQEQEDQGEDLWQKLKYPEKKTNERKMFRWMQKIEADEIHEKFGKIMQSAKQQVSITQSK